MVFQPLISTFHSLFTTITIMATATVVGVATTIHYQPLQPGLHFTTFVQHFIAHQKLTGHHYYYYCYQLDSNIVVVGYRPLFVLVSEIIIIIIIVTIISTAVVVQLSTVLPIIMYIKAFIIQFVLVTNVDYQFQMMNDPW